VTPREILARLVAFDTTSRNSNLELIAWVEAFLAARGVVSRRVVNEDGTKANLIATIGPPTAGGIVLSGHTDVVPVDDQPWTSDPFTLTERDGRLYGRGVADMKAFLALALAHVDTALAASLKRPLILAFSYDEEVGCLGVHSLIDDLLAQGPPPAAVLVGEPTLMRVVSGHKGIRTFNVVVTGREAHSSQIGQGFSAIEGAVRLINEIYAMARAAEAEADLASPFVPPAPTMTVGMIEGGTAVNILARRCAFSWDLRCPPGADVDAFEARFRAAATALDAEIKLIAPEGGVEVRRRSDSPAFAIDRDSEAERLARTLTGDNAIEVVAYATEAGVFQRNGLASVICGPGSIAQAHQPNEWLDPAQLELGSAFLRRLIGQLS
jgi:acetylornithine deacetylase